MAVAELQNENFTETLHSRRLPALEYNSCVPINFHLCTETAYELVTLKRIDHLNTHTRVGILILATPR